MDQKVRYELEFPLTSSPQLLYQYISTSSGLQEWFADKVNSRGDVYTFSWNGTEEKARLASKKNGEKVKFRWYDDDGNETEYFLELKIVEHEITKDVSLLVVDHAYEDDLDDAKQLWEIQIADLKHVIGSV